MHACMPTPAAPAASRLTVECDRATGRQGEIYYVADRSISLSNLPYVRSTINRGERSGPASRYEIL